MAVPRADLSKEVRRREGLAEVDAPGFQVPRLGIRLKQGVQMAEDDCDPGQPWTEHRASESQTAP